VLLPIDECEEWIWDILDSTKDCSFEYVADKDKEFLIFNTNDFHADTKAFVRQRGKLMKNVFQRQLTLLI
jgi:hypothetical protein